MHATSPVFRPSDIAIQKHGWAWVALTLKPRRCDLGLTQEGDWRTVWCEGEAEIGNSC